MPEKDLTEKEKSKQRLDAVAQLYKREFPYSKGGNDVWDLIVADLLGILDEHFLQGRIKTAATIVDKRKEADLKMMYKERGV